MAPWAPGTASHRRLIASLKTETIESLNIVPVVCKWSRTAFRRVYRKDNGGGGADMMTLSQSLSLQGSILDFSAVQTQEDLTALLKSCLTRNPMIRLIGPFFSSFGFFRFILLWCWFLTTKGNPFPWNKSQFYPEQNPPRGVVNKGHTISPQKTIKYEWISRGSVWGKEKALNFKVVSNGAILTQLLLQAIELPCNFTEQKKINFKFSPLLIFWPYCRLHFLGSRQHY